MNSVSLTYNLLDSERIAKLKGIPIKIVQGSQDNLCHPSIANELVNELREAGSSVSYSLVEGGGHSPYHPAMTDALVRATDFFVNNDHF